MHKSKGYGVISGRSRNRQRVAVGQVPHQSRRVAAQRARGVLRCAGLMALGLWPIMVQAAQPDVAEHQPPHPHAHGQHNAGAHTAHHAGPPAAVEARSSTSVQVNAHRYDYMFQPAQHEPDATTHLTAELLRNRDITTLRGLEHVAPNLTMQSINGTASTNFYLRGSGFNDFTQNNMPTVLTYVDDVAYPTPP